MVKEIKLSNCIISENNYPFIIAEIGNNHNGDITIAKKLIDEAQKMWRKRCEISNKRY